MQAGFSTALLAPDQPVPPGLVTPKGQVATRRFNVYRNNVVVSLIDAARAGFPALLHLVGEDFFNAMARVYVLTHPPGSRLMARFGADFPDFLTGFPPVAHLPYLADVARLELALRSSYHAADSTALDAATLAAWPPARLMGAHLTLAPALRLVRSDFPILGLWQMARGGPTPAPRAEDVLILRPDFDPVPHLLPPGGAAMIADLAAGRPLGAAAASVDEAALAGLIGALVAGNALISLTEGESNGPDHSPA